MLYFNNSTIQARVKDFFAHSLERDRLAHAYIFYGAAGRGKEAFAFELAKVLNCTAEGDRPCNKCASCIKINHLSHPDIKYLFPLSKQVSPESLVDFIKEKAKNLYAPIEVSGHKTISIEAIRELKSEAKYASFEGGKRVFIIQGAEYFTREAANSFLKLLEEPPENLYIFLIADDLGNLLDTIRSRCQPVYFPEFSEMEIEQILNHFQVAQKDLPQLVRSNQFNLKKIFKSLHSDLNSMREQVYSFIKSLAAANFYELAVVIEQLGRKRDKNEIQEFLSMLLLWFRDSLHYLILNDSSDFINLQYEENIKKFADYYRHVEMEKIIDLLETAKLDIRRNAHPGLTLTDLAIQIKSILSLKKPIREAV